MFSLLLSSIFILLTFGAGWSRAVQDPYGELLERVDPAELERVVRELSGDEPLYIGTVEVYLSSRYALSPGRDLALQYLLEEIEGYGYEPSVQNFLLSVRQASLTGIEVSAGGDSIWVADIDGRLSLATAAGGWNDREDIFSMEGELYDVELDGEGRLWSAWGLPNGGLGAILRSSDGGESWETYLSGPEIFTIYDIEIAGSNAVAVGAYGTVVLTAMGGQFWSVADPAAFRYQNAYGAAASGPTHFWVVTTDGTVFETPNLGGSWIERDLTSAQLYAVDFFGLRYGVIVGDGVSFHTADSGTSWTEAPAAFDLRHVAMIDSQRVLAGGATGELLYSVDGGAVWTELTGVCGSDEQVYRIASAGSDRLWIAGGNEVRMMEGADLQECTLYKYNDTIIGKNISFLHEGSEHPERRVLLTAHYDSYSSDPFVCAPGADDNATGVSAVLQAARALYGSWTDTSIEFVLFDGEELGLRGSRYFASALEEGIEYEAVINLDMLGYDHAVDRSLVIAGREDNPADSAIADFIRETTVSLGLAIYPEFAPGAALASDHRAFWNIEEMPSILLIEGYRDELTPGYHTCGDIADFIDYPYLELSAKAALGSVARLAGYVSSGSDTLLAVTAHLGQNWPNPFSEKTVIPYYLPEPARARLSVYDVGGREVSVLFDGVKVEGDHEFGWDGRGRWGERLSPGLYFFRLETSVGTDVLKFVILR